METKINIEERRRELTKTIEDAKININLKGKNLEEVKNSILSAIKKYGHTLDISVSDGSYITNPDFSLVGKDTEPLKNALYELGRALDSFSYESKEYWRKRIDTSERLLKSLETLV